MKITFQDRTIEHYPSACPDIEIRLSESLPYVQVLIGFDLHYLAPAAARDLAGILAQAADQIKKLEEKCG